jgi:hypothetical protein
MRRLALLTLPAAMVCATAAAAPAATAGLASVKVAECTPALEPEARSATFDARVRAVARTDRLAVRFTLQTRGQGELGWRKVVAPGLGDWLTSDHGVGRYGYLKTVRNLSAPASYRMTVRFRWLDAAGNVIRTAKQRSASCRQTDLRPDLDPRHVELHEAADPRDRRYVVSVKNAGLTLAPPASVTLRVGDRALPPAMTPAAAPGATRRVAFTAPACAAGEELEVTVDPGDVLDEADEENVLVVPCPAPDAAR